MPQQLFQTRTAPWVDSWACYEKYQEVEGDADDDDHETLQHTVHIDLALDNTDPTPVLQKPSALAALGRSRKDDQSCNVIRGGKRLVISTKDLVVGDLYVLEPGDAVPAHGIILPRQDVKCDESGATGASDLIKKFPHDDCIAERDAAGPSGTTKKDCFLFSSAKVTEGVGEYVVISVGTISFSGELLMSVRTEGKTTPPQTKLNRLAELIATFGASAGGLLFFALMIKFVQLKTDLERTAGEKGESFIQILIIAVTLVVVAVPEGLPLAVSLALAFAIKRMTKENLFVRVLASCETMASTSVICTDETGTLTTNQMAVVSAFLVIDKWSEI